MNKPAKYITGWIVWTLGVMIYAQFATELDIIHRERYMLQTMCEWSAGAYFLLVPIFTFLWAAPNITVDEPTDGW